MTATALEPVKWDFEPRTEHDMARALATPIWRLCNLYMIMVKSEDDSGEEQTLVRKFRPNRAQRRVLEKMWYRQVILKARQLGFTTLISILFLDCCLFRADVRAGIVCHNDEAAETIFRDKIKFAYDRLPDELKAAMPTTRVTTREILFAHNNSGIRVGTSMRSGTLQYLHVSEFGKMCARTPERAVEVMTGSIPALAPDGLLFIESTAEGREGYFFDISQRAERLEDQSAKLNRKDYRFFFFPWYEEPAYRLNPNGVAITDKQHDYFDQIEAEQGVELSMWQRAWYVSTLESDYAGDQTKMWQEYPSTPKEPFQVSTEGCYYTVQMTAARKQGRITTVPYVPGVPVNTFWDIGSGDGTAIWFHQHVGMQHRFIKFMEGWGEPYSHFVSEMQKTGYVWGTHYLPHDGAHIRQGEDQNKSPVEMLEALGLRNIEVVPRVAELQHGIQSVRNVLSECWFDEEGCKDGIKHLDMYKKKWNERTGRWSDVPLKDIHTEGADAFRQFAQGYTTTNVRAGQRPKRKRASARAV